MGPRGAYLPEVSMLRSRTVSLRARWYRLRRWDYRSRDHSSPGRTHTTMNMRTLCLHYYEYAYIVQHY